MNYAMSDLHGQYEKFREMLEQIHFSDSDTLYILGDTVDRGCGGIKLLQYLMTLKNVTVLRGNHDYIAYKLLFSCMHPETISDPSETAQDLALWFRDGGKPTFDSFRKLEPDQQNEVLRYLNFFLIYEETEINGRKFFLSHTIPSKEKMLNFESCEWSDFVFGDPEYDKQYFVDRYLVTGHIPTGIISSDNSGRIYRTNNHIAIDCGTGFGKPLGCIRLDDFAEYYSIL